MSVVAKQLFNMVLSVFIHCKTLQIACGYSWNNLYGIVKGMWLFLEKLVWHCEKIHGYSLMVL